MQQRRGEKIGWIGGWLGGFLWLCLLSIIWITQDKIMTGALGLSLFLVAIVTILALRPWKHPETKYWKLMLPVYTVLFASIGLCVCFAGGLDKIGLTWSSLMWLMPLFIPFATMGTRCWKDVIADKKPHESQ